MRILITGASGFLGRYIYSEFRERNEIETISRFTGTVLTDLADDIPVIPSVDIVIHAAGKAHSVPKKDIEVRTFYNVNVKGTENLIKGIENTDILPKSFVFISSVAVYGCDSGNTLNENSPLNANDPYGVSKIQAEKLVQDWCEKNSVVCTILRLPLLVGEEPPGNLGAMIRGIKKGYYFNIDGGKAKKSMVMASDVASFITKVASVGGVYNLTDGYHPSFYELSAVIAKKIGRPKPISIPLWLAKVMASFGDLLGNKAPINSSKLNKIVADLTFDDSKARNLVNWQPMSVIDNFKI